MKKIVYGALFVVIGALVWYLFIKPSDYTIRFTAKTFPGAINQTLKLWDKTLDTEAKIQQDGDIYHLTQKVKFGDSIHSYQWHIKPINDSTSKVTVDIKDLNHSLSNKLNVPFSDTDFEKRGRKTVRDFIENLQDHTKKFKVKILGEDEVPTKYLAYIPLKVSQFQKAGGMMKNFNYLTGELIANGAEFDGLPMIEVTHWDQEKDSIYYNFAQPIIRSEKLPIGSDIKYKRMFKKKALKAEYNGNYITSDRAWYALLDYAKRNNITVENTPVEVFYNSPHNGGDELKWKAEIYMPIKPENE
ncbi:GyrI-like domain-containing protein [Flagellimonas allohymeniacidonis]|uniref:AraC family transcriptional regulator n=1 Tax=Flagellimonas allohymeniacidonis TaxID=2517819 RepID=A0A4Q8QIE8_9FLAO|nr:GyrI-like domain-containing protein [Allomuricauda hymeniacidonis]TAI47976.1 AraC family transcriptional regulator [Allomuricauda hymeniacidonis]